MGRWHFQRAGHFARWIPSSGGLRESDSEHLAQANALVAVGSRRSKPPCASRAAARRTCYDEVDATRQSPLGEILGAPPGRRSAHWTSEMVEEIRETESHRRQYGRQCLDCHPALASLESADICPVHPCPVGKRFLGADPRSKTQLPQTCADFAPQAGPKRRRHHPLW